MGYLTSLASWAFVALVTAAAAFVGYECKPPKMMPGAHLPNAFVTENPKFDKMRGLTPEQLAAAMNGPEYDVAESVEMP